MTYFLNENHQKNFEQLISRDGTREADMDRRALFFVLAGSDSLMAAINSIYDFEKRGIYTRCFSKRQIAVKSPGEIALIRFAFNLYNGYDQQSDLYEVFLHVDLEGKRLCINAVEFKYMQHERQTRQLMGKMMAGTMEGSEGGKELQGLINITRPGEDKQVLSPVRAVHTGRRHDS